MKAILVVLVICGLGTIVASIYYTNVRIDALEKLINTSGSQIALETSGSIANLETAPSSDTTNPIKFECDETCKSEVSDFVDSLFEEKFTEVSTKSSSVTTTSPTKSLSTSYIPISAIYSTTNITWTDVPGSDTYVDSYNDYGSSAVVRFEISLKVNQGNGRAYARLWDDTNKVSPNNSEIYTESGEYTTQITQPISMWRGNNLYKIQVKSLNGSEAYINGAKLKIIH